VTLQPATTLFAQTFAPRAEMGWMQLGSRFVERVVCWPPPSPNAGTWRPQPGHRDHERHSQTSNPQAQCAPQRANPNGHGERHREPNQDRDECLRMSHGRCSATFGVVRAFRCPSVTLNTFKLCVNLRSQARLQRATGFPRGFIELQIPSFRSSSSRERAALFPRKTCAHYSLACPDCSCLKPLLQPLQWPENCTQSRQSTREPSA